jgi:glutamine synthetase
MDKVQAPSGSYDRRMPPIQTDHRDYVLRTTKERAVRTRHGRCGLVRVPSRRPGRESAARIELRSPDPACNPYLTFAIVLAAGLRGIERGYELGPEDDEPPRTTVPLPEDLGEATDLFERSELARDAFGERLCDWYVRNKRREWAEYRLTVSAFEHRRYVGLL